MWQHQTWGPTGIKVVPAAEEFFKVRASLQDGINKAIPVIILPSLPLTTLPEFPPCPQTECTERHKLEEKEKLCPPVVG